MGFCRSKKENKKNARGVGRGGWRGGVAEGEEGKASAGPTQTAQNSHSWLLLYRVMSLAQQAIRERKQQLCKYLVLHLTFTTGILTQFTWSKTLRFGEVTTISASPYQFNETFLFSFSWAYYEYLMYQNELKATTVHLLSSAPSIFWHQGLVSKIWH